MTKKRDYGEVKGGRDAKPEKNPPPRCSVHDQPGRYAFGTLVVCDLCDAGAPAPKPRADTFDEITQDNPSPWWFGRGYVP